MNILALDLGTRTGWALLDKDGSVRSGSESFAAKRHDGPGQRWLKFRAFLTETGRSTGELHAVYYEEVKRHGPGVQAAHVYGGFVAHLQAWCEVNRVPLVPAGVGTIKKAWTSKGNASKAEMVAEAKARGFKVLDDNQADALAILFYAKAEESRQ